MEVEAPIDRGRGFPHKERGFPQREGGGSHRWRVEVPPWRERGFPQREGGGSHRWRLVFPTGPWVEGGEEPSSCRSRLGIIKRLTVKWRGYFFKKTLVSAEAGRMRQNGPGRFGT